MTPEEYIAKKSKVQQYREQAMADLAGMDKETRRGYLRSEIQGANVPKPLQMLFHAKHVRDARKELGRNTATGLLGGGMLGGMGGSAIGSALIKNPKLKALGAVAGTGLGMLSGGALGGLGARAATKPGIQNKLNAKQLAMARHYKDIQEQKKTASLLMDTNAKLRGLKLAYVDPAVGEEQRKQDLHEQQLRFEEDKHQLELKKMEMNMGLEQQQGAMKMEHDQQRLQMQQEQQIQKQQEQEAARQEAMAQQQAEQQAMQAQQQPMLTQDDYRNNMMQAAQPKMAAYTAEDVLGAQPTLPIATGGLMGAGAAHFMFPSESAQKLRDAIAGKPKGALGKYRMHGRAFGANLGRVAKGAGIGMLAGLIAHKVMD